jgi:hypothetical protein
MADVATAYLDKQQFAQALAILEREKPSLPEKRRVTLMKWAAWGALVFSPGWFLVVLFEPAWAYFLLLSALACFLLVVPLFVANLSVVRKLWRAAVIRRKMRLSQRLEAAFRARRKKHWIYNKLTALMAVVGGVISVGGVYGLIFTAGSIVRDGRAALLSGEGPWVSEESRFQLEVAVVLVVFGLACMFIHFIQRGTERLAVVSELRTRLLASRDADTGAAGVPVEEYDQIAAMERAQIARDRRRSLVSARKAPSRTYALRIGRELRVAAADLTAEEFNHVNETIRRLASGPSPADVGDDGVADLVVVPVPGTSLEIDVVADHRQQELRVVSVRARTGHAQREASR